MHTKAESPEQNPSTNAELDSCPESGEVPQRRGERAAANELDPLVALAPGSSFFPTPDCLTDDEVLAFSEGRFSDSRQAAIEWHMDGCGSCQQLVQWAAWDIDASLGEGDGLSWLTTFSRGQIVAGRYRVVRYVTRGGMGEVYEAFDRKLQERVALKTMLCASSDSPRALERLCHEVALARRIAHPNVCRTHELHEHRERKRAGVPVHFVAMEFVDGETLTQRLARGLLPLPEAFDIARQLLCGLEAAHEAGVLHLDFKSSNVMLRASTQAPSSARGGSEPSSPLQAVIMDFSLSRAFDTAAHLRTSERRLAGSAGYMSPEQLEAQPKLGPASDIYSFGVVLFELLTGRSPFPGDSVPSIIARQLRDQPPAPSSVRRELPRALDTFVLKCLSREPRQRFANAGAALLAFDELVRDKTAPHRSARPVAPLLLGAALLGLGLSTVYVAQNEPPARGVEQSSVEQSSVEPPARPTVASTHVASQPAPASSAPLEPAVTPAPIVAVQQAAAPPPAAAAPAPSTRLAREPAQPKTRAPQPARAHRPAPLVSNGAPPPLDTRAAPASETAAPSAPARAAPAEPWRPQKAPSTLL
jgi:serine/threonine protein kinase